jgi:protoheme IX farnesyltransferase
MTGPAPSAAPVPRAPAPATAGSAVRARPLLYLELSKPRLAGLVVVTTLAGYYVSALGPVDWLRLAHLCVGTFLVAAGACAWNMWFERDADARMGRTADRPLSSGRISAGEVFAFAGVVTVVGGIELWWCVHWLCAVLALLTTATYILLYTPMKRLTPLNTVVGAIPGAIPALIGLAAARETLNDTRAFTLFGILFLWQLPHFLSIAWIHREDYARGGFRMMPVMDPDGTRTGRQILLHTFELLTVSLLPTVLGQAGAVYFYGALAAGLLFLAVGFLMARHRNELWARRHFRASIVYLPVVLLLWMFDKR